MGFISKRKYCFAMPCTVEKPAVTVRWSTEVLELWSNKVQPRSQPRSRTLRLALPFLHTIPHHTSLKDNAESQGVLRGPWSDGRAKGVGYIHKLSTYIQYQSTWSNTTRNIKGKATMVWYMANGSRMPCTGNNPFTWDRHSVKKICLLLMHPLLSTPSPCTLSLSQA